ncbi:E3 SUMO-protein ligase RanBP2 [Anabrus simplex]|uniref:E3 SUMO-protein ligase RanBP2 n=1 Tax=Anabrus simplex TaxID=316456 RepID=UPI0035A39326
MFRTKKDVDRHAQDVHRKVKSETERILKYYNLAKLYYQVGDYESARRYATGFLSVRDNSACGHKLLGQALEALGQKDKALAQYKCSLMLDRKQSDLVLKVCELMSEGEITDKGTGQYWCDQAEQLFPHNPVVFKLKEKLLKCEGETNSAELENLIAGELAARPTDVTLHVRLLKLYLEQDRVDEAFTQGLEQESKAIFREELSWYITLEEILKAYKQQNSGEIGWEFYLHYTSVLERLACLNLREQFDGPRHGFADCVQAIFRFDQVLEEASGQNPPSSEQDLYQIFLNHQRGQLCLHFATLLLKRAKKERSNWRDVCRVVAPLLLLAMSPPPDQNGSWLLHATKSRRKAAEWWVKEGAYRNSQAGHVILGLLQRENRTQFKDHVRQFCSGNWRERVYQKIFNTRDHQQAIGSSHFVKHSSFIEPQLELPSILELRPHDETSQKLHPGSLHHMIWLGLREFTNKRVGSSAGRLGPDFRCLVFETLQLTCNNLIMCGVETLNRLDIDAFLYAAVFCAKANLEEQQAAGFSNDDRPSTLPANITEMLCTVDQAKWWSAAYRVYTNQSRGDLGELRQTLQRGIEVVRVLGNHGLDVRLIVQLARTFTDRASSMGTRTEASAELTAVEARASLYWTSAMPLLDRLQRNQAIRSPHTRLFEYQGKELSTAEINTLIEEGRFFLACQLMKEEKYEKALDAFAQLKSPDASFYQAQIYKRLAAQEVEEKRGELITSEMRSQHIILLAKVRESLYLTLDRLRSPGVDPKHPLNAVISTHIEEIESQLARIDPDVCRGDVNRNDLDVLSDGSVCSEHSGGENINSFSGYINHSSYMHMTPKLLNGTRMNGTPYRSSNRPEWDSPAQDLTRRTEARPSPERLEAQIRQIMHGRDSHMQTLVQQNKAILESIRDVATSMSKIAEGFDEIKNLIQELVRKESKRHDTHNTSDLPQVDNEDDLYVFDDDYPEDVNAATSHLNQYQPFPPYPNYPGYRPMSGMLGGSTVAYGPPPPGEAGAGPPPLLPPGSAMGGFFRNMDPALMYPQTLGYYSQGALPFSEGQQLPDFRGAPGFSRLGAAAPAADSPNLHKLAQTPVAPVNVVITSSDTLPTTAPLTQPTLSVTIPPQHRLGTPLVHTVPVLGPPVLPPPPPPPVVMSLAATQQAAYPQPVPSIAPTVTAPTSSASGVPHAFQISMPPQAQLPIASRLEKGAAALSPVLPISTQTLLSSVPSPVYSAVVPDRSPASKEATPKQHRVSTGSATGEEEEGVENDHDPCPDFQPVIPLPAEVEVNTGEEDEKVIFENRCKLYRFVEKEWKERGVGLLKLLHHKETGKVRILMRREQVLKVCANHILSPDIELTPMGDRAWMWAVNDFADEKMQLEKLCARFKTAEEAANFRDAFNQGRELARNAKSSPGPKPSVAQKDRIPSSSAPSDKVSSTTTSSTSSTPSDKIVVGGFTFAAPPIFSTSQIAKDSMKEEKKVASPKPSPFASCFFGTTPSKLQSTTDAVAKEGNDGSSKPSLLGSKPDSSTSEVTSSQTEKNKTVDGATGRLMFSTPVDVSFSTLASAAKESPFKTDAPFKGFEGAGQPVFGGSQLPRTAVSPKSAETGEDGSAEDFVPTAEFKPVVPLPELVEVRTGEEDEEVLYQERAKLLRFDSDAKEWKERGTGQMKVLKDPKTERIRLLMRREQVLKVCCNHQLLKSMQFKSLATSDKAWTWCAQDYSEGEVKRETLAIRFKTVEQAKSFKDIIDKCQLSMKDGASATQEKIVPTNNWHCEKCLFSNAASISKCQSCSEPRYDTESVKEQPKLSELFRPPPGSWECSACYTQNSAGANKCVSCGTPNTSQTSTENSPKIEITSSPKSNAWKCSKCNFKNEDSLQNCDSCSADRADGSKKALSSKQSNASLKPLSEMFKPSAGTWECKTCYIRNGSHTITCAACTTPKPGHEATVAAREASPGSLTFGIQPGSGCGFSFGIPTGSGDSGGFKFGIPQSTATNATPTSTSTVSTGVFSTPTTKELIFGMPSVTPTVSTASKTTTTTTTANTTVTTTTAAPEIDSSKMPAKPFVFDHKTTTPFQFGSFGPSANEGNTKTSFNFGPSSKESGQPDGSQPNFVFGSSGDFKFNFSGIRPKSPVKSPKSPGVVVGSGGEDESGSEQDDDEGEHIYFQPVIPMPDKVPLHTGEEDEDILYCHRAKLFRFLGGEWKERGVGDVKILKNRTTHKIRLLMRREQVLKLCLNHLLTPEMNFLEKDEKSWLWNASDFSEGELQQERFAIRFVSKEVAQSFKEAVEKAKTELKETPKKVLSAEEQPLTVKTSTPNATKEQGNQSPAKSFTFTLSGDSGDSESTPKLKAGEVSGKEGVARTLFEDISTDSGGLNVTDISEEGQEPEESEVQEVYRLTVTPEERAKALQLKLPENFFSYKQKSPCPGCCGCEPDSDADEQQSSKTATPSGVNDKPKKCVLSPPQLSVPSLASTSVPKTTVSSIFSAAANNPVFGQPASFGLSTKGSLFSVPSTQEGPMPSIFGQRFTAAQQFSSLTATTAVTTFSFGASTTTSVFKLGTQAVTTTASVFDQTSSSTPLSTFSLTPSMTTTTTTATTTTTTTAAAITTTTSSLFSFGSKTTASVFTLSSTTTSTPSVSEPLTTTVVATTSTVAATTSLFSGQSFTQPRIPTTSTTSVFGSDKPLLGQSPAAFPKITSLFGQAIADTKPTTASIFGTVPGSTSSAVSATPVFGLRPAENEATCTAPSTATPSFVFSKSTFTSAAPAEPSKPFTFEFTKPPPATTASDLTTSEFKPKLGQIFSQPPPAQQPATVAEAKESEGVPFLPINDSLTFASVASKASEATFGSTGSEPSKPFQWANAGATIFGNSPLTRSPRSVTVGNGGPKSTPTPRKGGDSDQEEDDDGTGGGDDSTYDPHYEPIIALPDAIEVRTGEEEEEKVFCHRAKLYRFEASSKEWKERGVGEMKLLKHPEQGSYRLLLRREQVHKVVCNMRVTADLELKPLSTSDRTWCWGGMNYAEEEACVEQLAVRFKLPEIAQEFYNKVCEAVQDVSSRVNTGLVIESVRSAVSSETDEEDLEDVEDEEDDEEEDDDEYDGIERSIMFEKRATLSTKQPNDQNWNTLGQGDLRVIYDQDYFAARIVLEADGTGKLLCNNLIASNTELEVKKKNCTWSALDYTEETPVQRIFMARFSSETAALEFEQTVMEGREIANQSSIMDNMDPTQVLGD